MSPTQENAVDLHNEGGVLLTIATTVLGKNTAILSKSESLSLNNLLFFLTSNGSNLLFSSENSKFNNFTSI